MKNDGVFWFVHCLKEGRASKKHNENTTRALLPQLQMWEPEQLGTQTKGKSRLVTDIRIHHVSRVLGDPTVLQASLITPVVRLFRLPGPLEPSGALLERHGLCLPILPKERLVFWAEVVSGATLVQTTSSHIVIAKGSIVTCTTSASIEVFGTIGRSRCPFTYNSPQVEGREGVSLRTRDSNVLVFGTDNLVVGENLIDVYVHGHTGPSRLATDHEVIPVVETLERIVNYHDGIALQIKDINHTYIRLELYRPTC